MKHRPENYVLRLAKNQKGKDFVVGDIHGHFELFELLLKEISFNKNEDRIICVGDCIDRGPESERILEYLREPWFYSVLGNHEEMLLMAQNPLSSIHSFWMDNGGEWAEEVADELIKEMAEQFLELPYAISIETEHGEVGVVHADIPNNYSWTKLLEKLSKNKVKKRELEALLWSRETYREYCKSIENNELTKEYNVSGVHKVYVGHNIVPVPSLFGNLTFIDTGAYCNGRLTAVNLTTEEAVIVQHNSNENDFGQDVLSNPVSTHSNNLIEQSEMLLGIGENILEALVFRYSGANIQLCLRTLGQSIKDYKTSRNSSTHEKLEAAAHSFFDQFVLKNRNQKNSNQNLIEYFINIANSGLNNKFGVLRQVKLKNMESLCDMASRQSVSYIKLGVMGRAEEIKDMFEKISGELLDPSAYEMTESSILLWRISLAPDLILYLIGMPTDDPSNSMQYNSLVSRLTAVALKSSQDDALTSDEKAALLSSQMLCGMGKVQIIGPYARTSLNDSQFFFQKENRVDQKLALNLITPLLPSGFG